MALGGGHDPKCQQWFCVGGVLMSRRAEWWMTTFLPPSSCSSVAIFWCQHPPKKGSKVKITVRIIPPKQIAWRVKAITSDLFRQERNKILFWQQTGGSTNRSWIRALPLLLLSEALGDIGSISFQNFAYLATETRHSTLTIDNLVWSWTIWRWIINFVKKFI